LAVSRLAIASLFFLSGLSALIYEVLFAKSLSLTFGSTATASATVLAAYMGGMSIGAWLGGELGQKRTDPLRVYATCELLIAVYCALTPWLFSGLQKLYVALAQGTDPGRPTLILLQIVLGSLALLPATILMGITLPVLGKHFASHEALGSTIGLLYGANTLGAALGALLTGYLILPFFGVKATTWLAVVANLIVGYAALRLSHRPAPAARDNAQLEPAPADPRAGNNSATTNTHYHS
jgi:spermidine synthase